MLSGSGLLIAGSTVGFSRTNFRPRVGFYFMGGLNSDEETYSEVSSHRRRSSRPRQNKETYYLEDDDASDSEPVAKKPKGLHEERIEALKKKGPDPW
jgi:hypothetical protein